MSTSDERVRNGILDHFGSAPREFLERKGFGRSIQPGARPAVIVIDLSKAFTDPGSDVGADLEGHARRLLERTGEAGLAVADQLRAALADANKYVARVVNRHLNLLFSTDNQVK